MPSDIIAQNTPELANNSFWSKIFDVSDFPARWHCGDWSHFHGWLHIVSDFLVFGAYMAIPVVIMLYARKRKELFFPNIIWLFAGFIFFCGFTHLNEAIIFWFPFYRFAGLTKFATALVSWATVFALIRILPEALKLPTIASAEKKFRAVIDNAPYAVFSINSAGAITLVNSMGTKLFGFSNEELKGKAFDMLIPERYREQCAYHFKDILTHSYPETVEAKWELVGCHKTGNEFPVEIAMNSLPMDNDDLSILVTFSDIRERQKAEFALQSSEERMRCLSEISSENDSSNQEKIDKMLQRGALLLETELGIVSYVSKNDYHIISVFDQSRILQSGKTFSLENTYCNITLNSQEIVCADHTKTSSFHGHPCYDKGQLESYIGAPIYRSGKLYGTLNFTSKTPKKTPFSENDKEFVRLMSRWIGNLIAKQQFEDELIESQNRNSLVLDAISAGVWEWHNVNSDSAYWSPRFYQLLGYKEGELKASQSAFLQKLLHPNDRSKIEKAIQEHLAGNMLLEQECRLRNKKGVYHWFSMNAVLKTDDKGKPMSMIGSIQDITSEHEHQENLNQLTAELSRSNEELANFAYIASHDLKAPLRAIENLSSWVLEDGSERLPEKSQRHLGQLRQRVKRMESLLDALLEYSRAGRVHGELVQVDCHRLINDIIELLAPPETFKVEITSELPLLETISVPLSQCLQNLIGNAIKHNPNHQGWVHISAEENNTHVKFIVADNGKGIAAENHNRIFQMFQTLQSRDETEGSGMGLALIKKVVESYGGSISLDSQEGHGSTFYLVWPKNISQQFLKHG